MIHFVYLVLFATLLAVAFGALSSGTTRDRVLYGVKTFAQFVLISLLMAWVFYFLPW